jgi:ferritin-like protein
VAKKDELEIGQRVRFRRSHDRNVELSGAITKIHDVDDCVDVELENGTAETAHVSDVTAIAEVQAITETESTEETAGEEDSGTHGRGRRRR